MLSSDVYLKIASVKPDTALIKSNKPLIPTRVERAKHYGVDCVDMVHFSRWYHVFPTIIVGNPVANT
jgi:hypothetical protein